MFDALNKRSSTSKFWRLRNNARLQPQPWHWPLARIGKRDPRILTEHVCDTRKSFDLGYAVTSMDAQLYVPVFAAQSGEIAVAVETADGFAVSIEHGTRSSVTHYAHLSKLFVTPCTPKLHCRQFVRAGDVIGYAAKGPIHVRFELWRWTDDRGYVAVDVRPELAAWTKPLTTVDVRELAQEAA